MGRKILIGVLSLVAVLCFGLYFVKSHEETKVAKEIHSMEAEQRRLAIWQAKEDAWEKEREESAKAHSKQDEISEAAGRKETAGSSFFKMAEVEPVIPEQKKGDVEAAQISGSKSGDAEAASGEVSENAKSGAGAKEEKKDTGDVKPPKVLTQYRDTVAKNKDVFGWLTVKGLSISLPVMQSGNGDGGYYLHRDMNGKETNTGTLFVDPEASLYPTDQNIVIYGHNMKSGAMFGNLDLYRYEKYLEENPKVSFNTIYEKRQYKAIATVQTRILNQNEEGFRYYQFYNYKTKEKFKECRKFIKENLIAGSTSELKYGDEMLMLSTCEYSQENGRLILVCKRVK